MAKSFNFRRDGKEWVFTPGKNGSLVSIPARGERITKPLVVNRVPTAKVVMDPNLKDKGIYKDPASFKKRESISKVIMPKSGY